MIVSVPTATMISAALVTTPTLLATPPARAACGYTGTARLLAGRVIVVARSLPVTNGHRLI